MNELNSFLTARGYAAAIGLPLDGAFHRFDHGGSLSGWFKGVHVGEVLLATFGDWKADEAFEYKGVPANLSLEERTRIDAEIGSMKEQGRIERIEAQKSAANKCALIWSNAIDRGTTPYLTRKGLKSLHGAKICPDYPDTLLVPARDVEGTLWGIQRILPQKLDNGLDKLFTKDMRIEGCFHTLGTIDPEGEIYVCEGFATAASVFEAISGGGHGSPFAAVSVFNAGNLSSVCQALRGVYSKARLILCADNDLWTEKQGKPWNPGLEKATLAAENVGGQLRLPQFKNLDSRPTDFNDLACLEGLEVVKQQLLNPPVEALEAAAQPPKKKKLSEKLVAEWLLARYEGHLVRQDKSLFHYDGKKWDELDSVGLDKLRNDINSLCGDSLSSKDVSSCFATFFRYVPGVPAGKNLFEPARDKANFKNGTLHLSFRPKSPEELRASPGSGTHVFDTQFAPHAATDFCTTVLPMDYAPEANLPENAEFQQMLRNVWPDSDQGGKIALYEELLGACLVPLFPMVFFFVGVPRSGKSTLLILMSKLVGAANTSHCDPTTWTGFGMEGMINRLVNIDTDISITRKLPDDLMKKVIDPMGSIARKYKTAVEARLPAIHAFGSNDMPRNLEGGSGAYDRRAVIIRTTTPQAGFGGGGGFSDWVWTQGSQGILKAALRGLARLLSNGGRYTVPSSSIEEMEAWCLENDQVKQFLDAVEHGEVSGGQGQRSGDQLTLVISEDASIPAKVLYDRFVEHVRMDDGGGHNRSFILTQMQFSKRLRRDRRFGSLRTARCRIVSGIGVLGGLPPE